MKVDIMKTPEFRITVEISHIKLTLAIYDDISSLIEYVKYHSDDFQEDTLIGLIDLNNWLSVRNIKNELKPDSTMGVIRKIFGYILLKIAKTAYQANGGIK